MSKKDIYYSDKYTDDKFEYRHVMLPKDLAKLVPKTHLMSEAEWRNLGVQQSLGESSDQHGDNQFNNAMFRLGSLHASRAGAPYPSLQKTYHQMNELEDSTLQYLVFYTRCLYPRA